MCSTPRGLYLGDSSLLKSPPQAAEEGPATDEIATAEGSSGLGVSFSESMENGRASAATSAAKAAVLDDPDAGDCGNGDGEDWFEADKDTTTDFKYDYKEAICLDLSRAGGVAAVATQSTPGATSPVDDSGASRHEEALHNSSSSGNQAINGIDTDTDIIASTGGEETPKGRRAAANPNPVDMSVRGEYEMRRFTAAVAATADATADATPARSSAVGLSRRKAPMTPAVRYLLEAMCTDLQCCGECFVPHFRASQTLVRFCGFVPFEVDEGLDDETRHFMEGEHAHDASNGNADGGEAYGRGIGLPGIAWASARATLVEVSALTSDDSFDCGGAR